MNENSIIYKIWRILYPLLLYFLMDTLIIWAVQAVASVLQADASYSFFTGNMGAIASIIFLVISIPVCYSIYKRDYNSWAVWIYRKPAYFALLALIGVLASHGLSAAVSLLQIDQVAGDYSVIQSNIFSAGSVLVIVQTVILAPISEELLFRGIVYNRLRRYFGKFPLPALISSAIFGLYHFNLAQGIFAFLFGLLACAVYDKVRNLWSVIALHIGGNLISVVLIYTGWTYPSEGLYIAGMLAALAGASALYYFLIRPVRSLSESEL